MDYWFTQRWSTSSYSSLRSFGCLRLICTNPRGTFLSVWSENSLGSDHRRPFCRLRFVLLDRYSCYLEWKRSRSAASAGSSLFRWPPLHRFTRRTRRRKWTKRRCPSKVSTLIWSINTKNERTGTDPLRQRLIPLFLHRYRRLEETMNAENLSEQEVRTNESLCSIEIASLLV